MRTLADIDWPSWQPTDRATLVFVVRGHEVLLIHKRRGLGAGKVNAPGGRLEPGETPLQAAIREVEEEVCVTPVDLAETGELRFQFVDGYGLHVHVFRAADCLGEARETGEALPFWAPLDAIPYDAMWADDALWLPHLLAARRFHGRFLFDGETMLDHWLVVAPEGA
jgi:8-oxo-dGTP diphosphatase